MFFLVREPIDENCDSSRLHDIYIYLHDCKPLMEKYNSYFQHVHPLATIMETDPFLYSTGDGRFEGPIEP